MVLVKRNRESRGPCAHRVTFVRGGVRTPVRTTDYDEACSAGNAITFAIADLYDSIQPKNSGQFWNRPTNHAHWNLWIAPRSTTMGQQLLIWETILFEGSRFVIKTSFLFFFLPFLNLFVWFSCPIMIRSMILIC